MARAFGSYASKLPISSTKSATGHMMGACGVTEAITCIEALRHGLLPYTLNFCQQDEGNQLNVIAGQPLRANIKYAMSNTFGFGGQDSSLIFAAV